MIICLDGVDGTGKSTLANHIVTAVQKKFPDDKVIYKHATQIKNDVYTEYAQLFEEYIPGSGIHYILDRWHIGEEIYGPLFRGQSAFDKVSFRWLELFLASKGMRTWLMTQPEDLIQERLEERGEDFIRFDQINYIQKEYQRIVKHLPTFAKEISPIGYDQFLIDVIIKDAIYTEHQAALYQNFGVNYFGRVNIMPRTALVVENKKINKNFDPRLNKDSAKMLELLADGYWQQFAVISSSNVENIFKIFNEFLWSTSPVAHGETVISRLKHINLPFGIIEPPHDSAYYTNQVEQASNNVGKIELKEEDIVNL